MRRTTTWLILSAMGIAALAGCAPASGAEDGPNAFVQRTDLPPCGEVTVSQGESIAAESLDCLASAGTDGAELIVTAPTTEGDPITTYYRVLPDGGWEIFTDMTQDAFGGGWWFSACPDAVSIDDTGEYSNEELH